MPIKLLAKRGGGATNVFQSNPRSILLVKSSLYLSSKFVGKFSGNVVVRVLLILEGVEGSDEVSGNGKDVSDEISRGSFAKFGSPRRCVEVGGLKGFSRSCSDMGVDPK